MITTSLLIYLVNLLSGLYPESAHVVQLGMDRSDDLVIWEYAAKNEFTIVSKDNDFHQMAFVKGPPPKIVWIQAGNCSTQDVSRLLSQYHAEILKFAQDKISAFLALR